MGPILVWVLEEVTGHRNCRLHSPPCVSWALEDGSQRGSSIALPRHPPPLEGLLNPRALRQHP